MDLQNTDLSAVKYNTDGLVPAILQDHDTGLVLMMAWMNSESLKATLQTGKATFWSRSRQALWIKGESSGNFQIVESVKLDCDGDTLLFTVTPQGPACHTGAKTCFFQRIDC